MSSHEVTLERIRQSSPLGLAMNAGPTPPPERPPFRAAPKRLSNRVFGKVLRLFENWTARRRLSALRELDDRLLDDIGLRRDEIAWALALPLDRNPARELECRRGAERSQDRWVGRFALAAEERLVATLPTGQGGTALCSCDK